MPDAPPHLVALQRAVFQAQDAVRTFAALHRHGELTEAEARQWTELNTRERDAVLALWRAIDTDVPADQRQAMSWALRRAARGEG